jgi:hypothetical protein
VCGPQRLTVVQFVESHFLDGLSGALNAATGYFSTSRALLWIQAAAPLT